jgi:hypothetical protein
LSSFGALLIDAFIDAFIGAEVFCPFRRAFADAITDQARRAPGAYCAFRTREPLRGLRFRFAPAARERMARRIPMHKCETGAANLLAIVRARRGRAFGAGRLCFCPIKESARPCRYAGIPFQGR